jgi:integrase
MRNHVLPWFGAMSLDQAAKREEVVKWLDHQRALGTLKEGSIRGNLVVLGSFWTWLVERGEAATNPVSALPRSAKPRRQTRQVHTPWIQSDTDVIHIMDLLDVPARYAFYLANRSGLRPGEICGLRVQDLAEAEAGIIVVRFNFSGPLKEDKAGDGKSKVVPAPADITEVMGSYLAARRAEAKPSDPLFVYTPTAGRPRKDDWRGMTYDYLKTSWARVRAATGLTLTWYQATRHSFVSRSLAAGATYDEVSAAVGHSSVLITKAAYDHFERRQFSAITRAGLNREEK